MKIEKWNSEQMTCEVFALSTIVPYLQFSKEQIKILCKILGTHDWLLNIFTVFLFYIQIIALRKL